MSPSVKRTLENLAGRFGYTIVPQWRQKTFAGVQHIRRLFDLLAIDLVIDIGGNAGQYRNDLRNHVGYAGRIVTFEPVPALADVLKTRSVSDPLWTVEGRAIGASSGIVKINVTKTTEFSSFLTPSADSTAFSFGEHTAIQDSIPVELTTLEHVITKLQLDYEPKAIYLKIDTQGYELEVLVGAAGSLAKVAAMQAEIAFHKIYDGAPSYHDVIEYAGAKGFVVSGIFPNVSDQFPYLVDGDCFFVRKHDHH